MKIRLTKFSSLCLIMAGALAYLTLSSNSSGITGQSTAGCGGGGCHGSSGSATALSITGIPGTGWVASTAYTITVTVTNSAKSAAGFDLTVNTGTVSGASTGATASGTEVRHTTPKTLSSGTATWTFTWTAPASGSSVIFSMAGNAVNLNTQADAGDVWNTTTQTFAAAASSATAPTISGQNATSITNTTATLNASVNAKGASTAVTLVYGTTTSYGSVGTVTPATVTGTTATAVSASLTGLLPNTTYHYRFAAVNSAGTNAGTDATFKTTGLSVASLSAGGFRAFPNPVKEVLMIDAGAGKAAVQFTITDISGKAIPAQARRDGAYYNIATSNLAKGIYILRITAGEQVYGTSFVRE